MLEYLYSLASDKRKGVIAQSLKAILFVLAIIYGAFIRLLICLSLIRRKKLLLKVISVGNITLGGTGKTSLVEFIALKLKNNGHRSAILSRGYKSAKGNIGDEPVMLAEKLSGVEVITGKDRISSANQAAAIPGVDTVILDDAFQQWRIIKDLDIVLINALEPFGNLQMLPRGILREPLSSLKRAGIFVITKTNLVRDTQKIRQLLNKINPAAQVFEAVHLAEGFYSINNKEKIMGPESLKGKTALIFSGIGDPDSFERLLSAQGLKISLSFKFPDHHNYAKHDLDSIISAAQGENIDTIITTEKDAVRLKGLALPQGLEILVLKIKLAIINEEKFISRLLGIYPA
ncbi:MAG: tetraacyldisaccharide 4'-kinase [Candidatus Omnitrophota bacterium]|jgi:tetraacyldisaccharide 4'-kinase